MDLTSPLPNCKSRKNLNGEIVVESEDRISNLPDGVLQYILSFLPTKAAIGTCILSKKWQFLWTSISKIEFDSCGEDDHNLCEGTCILDFVERVLMLHDSSDIEKFSISCHAEISSFRVNTWISVAISHRVQVLELYINCTNLVLPHCLFTCESMTILKLEADCLLKVPTSICFPSLKNLYLSQVTFLDDHSTQRLFSSCPMLEELSLKYCVWDNIKRLSIFVPCLKNLLIDCYKDSPDSNLVDCKVKVYAQNLIFLRCNDDFRIDLLLCNMASIVEAVVLSCPVAQLLEEQACRALRLLVGIRNVEELIISNDIFQILSIEQFDRLPMFSKLTELRVAMQFHYYASKAMKIFLQHLPHLETLVFYVGPDTHLSFDEHDWILEPAPQCLKASLKGFIFHDFHGSEMEINWLKYFLKNAVLLETMKIYSSESLSENSKKQEELSDQLQRLPRGSTNCVIKLENPFA